MSAIGPIGTGCVFAILLFTWGWTAAARFRSERGRSPWAIPPGIWGALYVIVPVGWVLFVAASRTTRVVDISLAHRADSMIADTAEERARLHQIASELPLLRAPDPNTRGWYLDPLGQKRFRFYDGRRWTRDVTQDPALTVSAAGGDSKADLKRRLLAIPPPQDKSASWHIDPLGTYHFRYFDGQEWTEEVRRARGPS